MASGKSYQLASAQVRGTIVTDLLVTGRFTPFPTSLRSHAHPQCVQSGTRTIVGLRVTRVSEIRRSIAVPRIMTRHQDTDGLRIRAVLRLRAIPILVLRLASAVIALILCALAAALAMYLWQLHFWIPEGEAFALGKWEFDGCEFQVWQRKTRYLSEPFADGLFVRETNGWQVFCFDIQDNFRPGIKLIKADGRVQVLRDGENRGEYDTQARVFRRHGQDMTPQFIRGDPPGEWRLRPRLR